VFLKLWTAGERRRFKCHVSRRSRRKKRQLESHGNGGGEGAAGGSRASAFSLPSSAARHAQSTAEKKAARVRPPRLSHELIDFAPRGRGGGMNAMQSSEGEEEKGAKK
jgi:hypothetical protein